MVENTETVDRRGAPAWDWERQARARIDTQAALVAKLEPGSEAHRTATGVLLLFRDTLHVIMDAQRTLERLAGIEPDGR